MRARARAGHLAGGAVIILLGVPIATAGAVGSQDPESRYAGVEHIASQNVQIRIEASGDLLIDEEIEYFFASGRRGIERQFVIDETYDEDYKRHYDIDILSVSASPGTPAQYQTRTERDALILRIGDPDETIFGEHTYRISYRVHDALNGFSDHDELYWDVLGDRTQVPLAAATVTVTGPGPLSDPACFEGYSFSLSSLSEPCPSAIAAGRTATFRTSDLRPRQGLTIGVSFPTGLVPTPRPDISPIRYSSPWWRDWAKPNALTGLLGVGSVALLGAGYVRQMRRRPPQPQPAPTLGVAPAPDGLTPVEFAPPDGLTPGQLGTLLDGSADTRDVAAVLLDLARRGYLTITPQESGKDWSLTSVRAADENLAEHEKRLVSGIFAGKDTVLLSSMRGTFLAVIKGVQSALYRDGMAAGWFGEDPARARKRRRKAAIWLGVLGVVLFLATISYGKHMLATIPILLAAGYVFLDARRRTFRTAEGDAVAARAAGFGRFIAEADAGRAQLAERENVLLEYLPYAVAFGVTDRWATRFAELNVAPPAWFGGSEMFDPDRFERDLDRFLDDVKRTGEPVASSGGSGGSSSGSRSYSSSSGGGGRSGGGGGGGGTGSW